LIVLFPVIIFGQTYSDPNAAIEDRIEDLLQNMTLKEKIGQMLQPIETKEVKFLLSAEDLAVLNSEFKPRIESGDFKLWVGPNSA